MNDSNEVLNQTDYLTFISYRHADNTEEDLSTAITDALDRSQYLIVLFST